MSSNTPNLDLLKKDPVVEGEDTFNIKTMMNDNWDKLDEAVGKIRDDIQNIDVDIPDATLTHKGIAMLSNATNGTRENVAATEKAVGLAFQAGNERKAEVVAVLVSKGITATTAESWATLIPKITAIVTATGTAVLADVLVGKTFSTAAGNTMVGTAMPRVPNLIKNGSFENGLASWILQGMTGQIYSDNAKFGTKRLAVNAPASVTEGFLQQSLRYVNNHRYYACGHILSAAAVSMDMYFPLIAPYSSITGMSVGGGNVWKFFSGIIPAITTVTSQKAHLRIDINNGNVNIDAWLDGLMLIDLTESFGVGKEPDKATMDAIVQGAGGWWDSVIPTITNDYSVYPTDASGYAPVKSVKSDGGGNLVFEPETGFYESGLNIGGYGAILANDPDFIASNFRADKNVFGLQGSIPVLKPSVSNGIYNTPSLIYGDAIGDGTSLYFSVPNGHVLDGVIWVRSKEPNLIPGNVRKGVSLFNGNLVGTLNPGYSPGATVIYVSPAGRESGYDYMVKGLNIAVSRGGTYRMFFSATSTTGYLGYCQIYINDQPRGILREVLGFQQFTEDITINDGDVVQIYQRQATSGKGIKVNVLQLGISDTFTWSNP